MSLYSAMIAGVTGLKSQSQALAVVGDNIANVNTAGYKRGHVSFSSMVTRTGNDVAFSAGGVRTRSQQLIDQQGVLQAAQRTTDIAINGNGFFVVNNNGGGVLAGGQQQYTRAGAFTEDNQGLLRNTAGLFLQGWRLDSSGAIINPSALESVDLDSINGVAVASDRVVVKANLDASLAAVAPATTGAADFGNPPTFADLNDLANLTGPFTAFTGHVTNTMTVYDALGVSHTLTMRAIRLDPQASNQWGMVVTAPSGEINAAGMPAGPAGANRVVGWGTITFNGAGSLSALNLFGSNAAGAAWVGAGASNTLNIAWNNGANNSAIDFNLGTIGAADGLTQFDSARSYTTLIDANGAPVGQRTGVLIDEEGFVTLQFDNGATRRIYQLPVATFPDPNLLLARAGNAYLATGGSGEPNLQLSGVGGAGKIAPQALEESNVDLGKEFTDMIVIQRAYAANSKIITTSDEMLDELIRIKR
jgi:flagellar hook protein FlgE